MPEVIHIGALLIDLFDVDGRLAVVVGRMEIDETTLFTLLWSDGYQEKVTPLYVKKYLRIVA